MCYSWYERATKPLDNIRRNKMKKLTKNRRPALHSCRLRFKDFGFRLVKGWWSPMDFNTYYIIRLDSPVKHYVGDIVDFLNNEDNKQYIIKSKLSEKQVIDFYIRCQNLAWSI